MKITKRVGAALTASALALGLLAAPFENGLFSVGIGVSAEESLAALTSPTVYCSADSLPDSSELEELYINKLFYGEDFSFYKDYGHTLTGTQREVYEALRSKIEDVANGTSSSTVFTLTRTISVSSNDEASAELKKFGEEIKKSVQYLLVDLPADFYWYDKTPSGGMKASGGAGGTLDECTLTYNVTFSVSQDYMSGNNTTVDTAKIAAAKTAASNAKSIAANYNGKTDYEKIVGFCQEICALTAYNDDAANDKATPYGDPWQLVWVFDGDNSTDVVCEGYSKAFQYLCDLSGIECYTVTGKMTGGTGAGDHMWNIVVLDGASYLVDITNCDDGTIGNPDKLLLKGASESTASGCTFSDISLNYEYDEETLALYSSAGILEVSTEDYGSEEYISISVTPHEKTIAVDDTFDVSVIVTASEGYVGVDGDFIFDFDEAIIQVDDNGEDDATGCSIFTVTGLSEGETELAIGWKPAENSGVTLEDGSIWDVCTVTVEAAECVHEWSNEWESDETGHWHLCTKCDTGKSEVVKHTETEGNNGKEATCTEKGREADTICSVCKFVIETGKEIPAKGHTGGDPIQENVNGATCTEAGSYDEVVYCEVCNEEISRKTVTGETLPHDLEEVPGSASEPTCAEAGKEADQKCKNCDYTKTGAAIPATGDHIPAAPVHEDEVAATCTKEGSYNEVIKCKVCGHLISSTPKVIEKIDHTPGEPTRENEVPATCDKNGSYDEIIKCTVCDKLIESNHKTINSRGHTISESWQSDDTSHYKICAVCGDKLAETAHTEDAGRVINPAAEGEEGLKRYFCTICEKALRDEIIPSVEEGHVHDYSKWGYDSNGHWRECLCGAVDESTKTTYHDRAPDEKIIHAVLPTCGSMGLDIYYSFCETCGVKLREDYLPIDPTGNHTPGTEYGSDDSKHWLTCTVCGDRVNEESHTAGPAATETTPQTCTVCGHEMAPVLAHTHKYADTWTSNDTHHWHAAVCEHTEEVKDMALHAWDNGVVTTQPTETSKGEKTFTCGVCGATKTESVSELTHTHTPGTSWRYDATGHWHECGSCSEKLNFAGHNEVSEVTKLPLATVTGTRRYYCSICKYIIREETIPATGVTGEPTYPSGSTIVFPPVIITNEPKLDNGSGKSGWESIADDIRNAASGSAIRVDMNGTTILSNKALRELIGKNVDLVLEMNDKITWTINGETVSSTKDTNMKAILNMNNIPEIALEDYTAGNSIVQLTLSHRGNFGFDAVMTVDLGSRYNGKYANLLYYNQSSNDLEFIDCSVISGGMAVLDFSHASEYAVVISDEPMGDYEDVSAAAGIYENDSMISLGGGVFSAIAIIGAVAAATLIFRKRISK